MLYSYALYPFDAEKYHKKFSITPGSQIDVGFLGHKLYTAKFEDLKVLRRFSRKSATPVYFSLPVSVSAKPNDENFIEILKGYFLSLTGRIVAFEVIPYAEFTLFYPIFQDQYLYLYESESVFFKDLTQFMSRRYLSTSSLALENTSFPGVSLDNMGIVTYDERIEFLVSPSELTMRKLELSTSIKTQLEDGIVTFASDDPDSSILIELSEVWNLRRRITPTSVTVYGSKVDQMKRHRFKENNNLEKRVVYLESLARLQELDPVKLTGYSFNNWVSESIRRIRLGKTPLLRTFTRSVNLSKVFDMMIEQNPFLEAAKGELSFTSVDRDRGFYYIPVLTPQDLLLARKLINSELGDDAVAESILSTESSKTEKSIWSITTENGDHYEVVDDKTLSDNEIDKRWMDGYYASPWGAYILYTLSVHSDAYVKLDI